MNDTQKSTDAGHRHSRTSWALLGFLVIAGFFLFSEHRAHWLGALPFLLLALCPLLHFFHSHGDHATHAGPRDGDSEKES